MDTLIISVVVALMVLIPMAVALRNAKRLSQQRLDALAIAAKDTSLLLLAPTLSTSNAASLTAIRNRLDQAVTLR